MENHQAENAQAMAAWREDEERAFAGQCLSAETRADAHAGHARVDKKKLQLLAENHPALFMGLMGTLSPLGQDVLIQYYVLRRTQEQIGELLGVKQNAVHYMIGDAIGEIKGTRKAGRKSFARTRVVVRRGKWVGADEIPIEESVLRECFQPTNGNL